MRCLSRALGAALVSMLVPAMAAQRGEHYAMDYGPFLMTTVGCDFPADNVALKGLAIPVGGGQATMLYDTELLRVAGAWTDGYLVLTGTPFDGDHGPHVRMRGCQAFGSGVRPGWAKDGSFQDPRPIPHGPLPHSWARYRGLYRHGDQVVIAYTVGACEVLELPGFEQRGTTRAFSRTLEMGPSATPQRVLVAERLGAEPWLLAAGLAPWTEASAAPAVGAVLRRGHPKIERVTVDRTSGPWSALATGAPAADDLAAAARVTFEPKLGKPSAGAGADVKAEGEPGLLPRLVDGATAEHEDDPDHCTWFEGKRAAIIIDLGKVVEVTEVRTWSWHLRNRAGQQYVLWGSAAEPRPATDGDDFAQAGWTRLADVDAPGPDKVGVRIAPPEGRLGSFRWLVLELHGRGVGSFLTELDVYGGDCPAPAVSAADMATAAVVVGAPPGGRWLVPAPGQLAFELPPRAQTASIKILTWDGPVADLTPFRALATTSPAPVELTPLTKGGPARWTEPVVTVGKRAADEGAYVVDTLTVPYDNPWRSRMRLAGLDFFRDGRAAVSTWNGDVWIVSGIDDSLTALRWQRFATGLFDPLGLKIVDGVVHTLGRDGITKLHDLDRDGEADWYQCFNNDVLMTEAFHEFAFDLHTDPEGNFYFAKAGPVRPGGRGFEKLVPHHGCILQVSKDGSKLDVYATGLRAPNGIGVGPDGQVTSGDNEGTWTPRCRINWIKRGGFCGCVDTAHRDPVPKLYDLPVCWLPMEVDNSGGSQVWVTSQQWGPLEGQLLHLSYGTCSVYHVLRQEIDGVVQGGVVRLPLSFSSSCMRARFHPVDQQLYLCGLQGWQTSAAKLAALHRVRYTGGKTYLPDRLEVFADGLQLHFPQPLDVKLATDLASWDVEQWNYVWSERYGSPEVSTIDPEKDLAQIQDDQWNTYQNHDLVTVKAVHLSADARRVSLIIDGLKPVMQMRVRFDLEAADGEPLRGEVFHSIHRVPATPAPKGE